MGQVPKRLRDLHPWRHSDLEGTHMSQEQPDLLTHGFELGVKPEPSRALLQSM